MTESELSRLAEAVRNACRDVCEHHAGCTGDGCNVDCDVEMVGRLDLAPIIARTIAASVPIAHIPALPVTDAGNALVDGLLAEAHARAGRMGLPVIRECGQCSGYYDGDNSWNGCHVDVPEHGRPEPWRSVDSEKAPPPECPLRKDPPR